ncbi:helix-turn-helix transcriptional regulator [Lederbergia lenta]|uniref:helix-turn-helix transcriptional regulator n=1 Tax=Lederbergia lenta TaxID=1467 RepID=UPI00203B00AF|nr:helix-turn-helix transcriptional regulator [Lederbergia lenta]MCM3111645.1 helix-turn-helix transcriptional regulator [Lederbergia lenta]
MRSWLKNYRNARGLTQEETSYLSGISRSYYTHIEQGSKTPTVEVAKNIAKTLKFDWVLFFNSIGSLEEQKSKICS